MADEHHDVAESGDDIPKPSTVPETSDDPGKSGLADAARGTLRRAAARMRRVAQAVPSPPPGPFRPGFWRSPIRGPWLTAVFGLLLLVGITILFVTGLLSYAAYNPGLGAINDQTPDKGILGFYLFTWPTDPYWIYRVNQGVHVTLGVALVPVLLAKLWSVIPKLFEWPPFRNPAHLQERLSLLLLVGGAVFEFATGLLNIQLHYIFPGSFYTLHFYGAWVFIAAFVVHVALRLSRMWQALRSCSLAQVLRTDTAHTEPESSPDALVAGSPRAPTMSRRGALALTGAGSLALLVVTAGQSIGGPWRRTALLAPHNREPFSGPNGFQVNKQAAAVGITAEDIGPAWRLNIHGPNGTRTFTREQLMAMPQAAAALPIACVEGWSTDDQHWSGLRLADLAALAGLGHASSVLVESVQRSGSFRKVLLAGNQIHDPRSLLALRVNGADLSPDHGYPARIIVPANPGVNNTKWVADLTFRR